MMTIQYDFKTGYPDLSIVPRERLSALASDVITSGRGLQYGGDLHGIVHVREQIAAYLHGVTGANISADDLMITTGALTGIDIVTRTLTQPGDVVIVEDPTFFFAVDLIRMSKVEIISVPIREHGIDLDMLESVLKLNRGRVELLYTIPSFQNPTGYTASDANRRALIALAERYNFTILEDSTYQPLYYDAPPPPYLKCYDTGSRVVSLGSMSKLIMPSLRFGWAWATPHQITRFMRFKSDAAASTLTSEIVADFIESGEFTGQVERARSIYARKHAITAAALDRFAPDWLDWHAPNGGFFMWLKLPQGITASDALKKLNARGVDLFTGRASYVNPPDDQALRLCFAMLPDDLLEPGIQALSAGLRELG